MKIAIGSDHRGFEVKRRIVALLQQLGHEVDDVGPEGKDSVDYPDFAFQVAQAVGDGAAAARHLDLRHRHRHVHRCQQGVGRAGRAVSRQHHRRDEPPTQRRQRAVPVGRSARRGVDRAAWSRSGWKPNSRAAAMPAASRKSCASRSNHGQAHEMRGDAQRPLLFLPFLPREPFLPLLRLLPCRANSLFNGSWNPGRTSPPSSTSPSAEARTGFVFSFADRGRRARRRRYASPGRSAKYRSSR